MWLVNMLNGYQFISKATKFSSILFPGYGKTKFV